MSMVYVGYLGILLMLSLSVLGMPMAYAMCVVPLWASVSL